MNGMVTAAINVPPKGRKRLSGEVESLLLVILMITLIPIQHLVAQARAQIQKFQF